MEGDAEQDWGTIKNDSERFVFVSLVTGRKRAGGGVLKKCFCSKTVEFLPNFTRSKTEKDN